MPDKKKIKKILIANRGEIVSRIQKTCQRLGIDTVVIYSDADKGMPYILEAQQSNFVGASESKESYLNMEKIIQIAQESGADAIHPGYGFLSENPQFAKKVMDAGIVFIGPKPESMEAMGDKIQARQIMEKAGVPIVPGFSSTHPNPQEFLQKAKEIGFPIMIKATAGGGGKGMRKVEKEEEFLPSMEAAMREAEKAFGDGRIFIEKYIQNPRHIEFQIFGDTYGNCIHIHERDCSIQRRHQKILEESPAPSFPTIWKERMGRTAIQCAKAIGYVGAGTVEFIYDPQGGYYFLEMNTRLQVEHPVTEMVTGLDLVELQIRVAEGEELPEPLTIPHGIPQNGHSIEVRIYAEDPENQFLPSIGTIHWMKVPKGPGIRWDSAIAVGMEIGIFYDPMIGKLIAHAENRENCRQKLIKALQELVVFGPKTNIGFLIELLQDEDFQRGRVSTHFIQEKPIFNQIHLPSVAEAAAMVAKISLEPQKTTHLWKEVGHAFSI